jgi:hypothetical protein
VRFGHSPEVCWSVSQNANLRPAYWKGQARAQHGQNVRNGHNLNENMPDWSVSMYGQIGNNGNNNQHENGNMSIDSEAIDQELSFAVGHMKREDK